MSVQLAPPLRDSKRCPTPAPGPSVHLREKPLRCTRTLRPPATQVRPSLASAVNGAMKRAPAPPSALSGGATLYEVALVGSVDQEPSLTAQLLVTAMARYTYSLAMLQPLAASTRVSPPSPPKFEPITRSPARLIDWPLSCNPPEIVTPPVAPS